jgi:hypothetical protein
VLNIRNEQATAFQANAYTGFLRRAVQHLRKELPHRVVDRSDPELADWARDATRRAETYGLRTERQIMFFLDAEVLLGANFYADPRHAWAATVLQSNKLHPDDKAGTLLATACSLDRERARRDKNR